MTARPGDDCAKTPILNNVIEQPKFAEPGGGARQPAIAPSFREISESFSKRERFQHLAAETAAFVVICLTAGASLYVLAMTTAQFLWSQ